MFIDLLVSILGVYVFTPLTIFICNYFLGKHPVSLILTGLTIGLSAPFALWLRKKIQAKNFPFWTLAIPSMFGGGLAGILIMLLQPLHLLNNFIVFSSFLIPGIYTFYLYNKQFDNVYKIAYFVGEKLDLSTKMKKGTLRILESSLVIENEEEHLEIPLKNTHEIQKFRHYKLGTMLSLKTNNHQYYFTVTKRNWWGYFLIIDPFRTNTLYNLIKA
jgi:hypothetical protein